MTWANPQTRVHLTRTFTATVERVFRAFTDPRDLRVWGWAGMGTPVRHEVDLRIGGRYAMYIAVDEAKGWPSREWGVSGLYVEIVQNRRLIYTLHWDAPVGYNQKGQPLTDEAVIVEFTPVGASTVVDFHHLGIPDDGVSAGEHAKGLEMAFDVLSRHLTDEALKSPPAIAAPPSQPQWPAVRPSSFTTIIGAPVQSILFIHASHVAELKAHGVSGFPNEVCGLLVGTKTPEGHKYVAQIRRCANINTLRAHDRFELDPKDYTRIEDEARAAGLEILGVYHTHPNHPCRPSETDRVQAAAWWGDLESWSYPILEVSRGKPGAWKSWVLKNGRFYEETVKVVEDLPSAGS